MEGCQVSFGTESTQRKCSLVAALHKQVLRKEYGNLIPDGSVPLHPILNSTYETCIVVWMCYVNSLALCSGPSGHLLMLF